MEAAKHAKKFDFKALMISPMRRTLETAYYIFKDHPNFKTMQFIVNPDLREKITITGDVPLNNSQLAKELQEVYQPMFQNRLDVSKLEQAMKIREPWYLSNLA